MANILFVCTANRFRSPLAALYFARELVRHGDDQDVRVSSAGTWTIPERPATPEVIAFAKSLGLNLSMHKSRVVSKRILSDADLVVVMESGHKESLSNEFPATSDQIYLLSDIIQGVSYDIPDPYTGDEKIEDIANEIIALIDKGYEKFITLARKRQNRKGS